ncbi:MAG TPA: EAL domain-containing protein [Burkholderiales bacterium]|nr:EAL domain-containing protein [Burkholderiales bacterium]
MSRVVLVAVAYFLTARASMQFSGLPAHISFIWLPAGISLAALLLGGLKLAPGIALGAFLAQFSIGGGWWMSCLFALGNTSSGLAGAWLLQHKLGFSRALDHPRHLLALIGVGAFLSPVIAATFGASGAHWSHLAQWQEWAGLWTTWWAGDALGILLVTPVLLSWARARGQPLAVPRPIVGLGALQLLVGAYVFAMHGAMGVGAYVYLVLALLTAMHLPLTWVTVLNLLTFGAAAASTLLGSGPFADASAQGALVSLQTYGIVSSLATLLVSSLAQEREKVAAQLTLSVDRFQHLTTLSSDWYWEQDENLRFTHIAGRAVEENRLRREDIIGRTHWDVEAGSPDEEAQRMYDAAVAAREPFRDIVLTRYNMGPEPRIVAVSGAPIIDRDGRFRGYRGVARDITLQRQAEREVEESKRFLDALINAIPTPVLVKDQQHRYIAANASFFRFFSRRPEDILGKTDYDFFSPEDAAYYQSTDLSALAGGAPVEYEHVYDVAGGPRGMLVRKSALTRPDGSRVVVLVLIDVTERRAAEQQVRSSEQRFRSLTELSADWYWEQDAQLRFTFFSDASGKTVTPANELFGKTRFELDIEWESDAAREQHAHQLAAHLPFKDLLFRDSKSGRWAQISGEPVFDTQGTFTGYRGVGRDVTAHRRAEQAVRDSEARFRALTELSSDWYWEQDAQFRFTRIAGAPDHPVVAQLQAHVGHAPWDLALEPAPPARWPEHRALLEAHRSFRDLELACRLENGAELHMSLNGEPVFDSHGEFLGYRGTAKDITERKIAQQHIARLKDMYAAMSEANGMIVHSRNQDELFSAICRIAVDIVHFVFARVALIDVKTRLVNTVASAGDDKGYLPQFSFPLDASAPLGQGPSGHALRTGTNVVCNDISAEPRTKPWREMFADLGIRSMATFVLRCQGKVVGTLNLYAAPSNFFDDELVGLLDKLAMNLSFALDNFQREDARRAAEDALRESENRFRDFAAAAGEYVWEADIEGRTTYVSSRVQSVWGYTDQELIGHTPADFMPAGEAERVRDWLGHNMRPDGSFSDLEHMILNRQGETRWLLINAVGLFDAHGKRIGQRGTGRDITDRKNAEARISYLATRDPLTELPNRVLFNDRLEQGIVAARRSGQSLALLFIDLDRFKNINDSLGHQVGDLLLKEVASRMQVCIRKGDTLSRLGGDEFVVTLEGLMQAEDASQVAGKIIKALSRPFEIAGHTLNTSCSIGISIFPLDADDDRALMKNADTAMYHAKDKGRNNYQFFSPEMNVRAVERHTLETSLRLAIERQEFTLYYQPQVDMATAKVVGMEALLRWHHPERGLLSPATFIDVAEESGLIDPIGQWVLRSACQRAKAWLDAGYPALKVAVNISPRQLIHPKEFSRSISRILNATGLDPRFLELEMTESLLVQNAEENIAVLRKLGQDGVRIAVDDFGTGYSSLSYLRQLPIDTLKIDRSFVRDIETDPEDLEIIKAIIAMAHSLKLQVTAEGVETRGQLEALARLGCDEYQGYLFSKPLPAVEIAARFLAPRQLDFAAREASSNP